MNNPDNPFFVGYLPAPRALRPFLLVICVIFVSGLAGLGLALGVAQDDPGEVAEIANDDAVIVILDPEPSAFFSHPN